jgi:MFS family permease
MDGGGRFGVLKEPDFRRLFLGRTVSLVGDGIAPIALAFAVLDLTGSATDLGIVLAVHSVVIIGLILVGGVFADRISPRVAMLRADLVRMATVGLIAVLLIAGVAQIWQLAVLYAIEGAATAFFNPASDAIVAGIVAPDRLQQANALLNLSRWGGRVAGPTIAGILLALGTPGWALAVDAASFGVSAAFLLRLRPASPPEAGELSFVAELRHGWKEFSSRTWLWVIVTGAAISNGIYTPVVQVLGPLVAKESLGGSSAWALIAGSLGVGAVVGGVASLSIRPRRPLLLGEGALVLFTLPVFLLVIPASVALIAAGALLGGVTISICEVLYETTMATQIPQESLSRVYAYDWFGSLALEPLTLAVVGPLAAGIGVSSTLLLGGILLVACQCIVISVPSVRRLQAHHGLGPMPIPALRPIEPGD